MGHLVVSRVHVLTCGTCGRVIQVSPVNQHRVAKLIVPVGCCSFPEPEWQIRGIIRVWPRWDCEELYFAASLEEDEYQGREVWPLEPLHLEQLGILRQRQAASTDEADATRSWYAR